jgi:hypothetical protein
MSGIIRVVGIDNNTGADWVQSDSPTPLQTIGTYDAGYLITNTALSVSWSPITGLFTDALLTTPYVSGNVTAIFAKPSGSSVTTYTATSNTSCPSTATATVTALPAGTLEWTGAVNTDWNNAGNWKCGIIPILTSDVIINGGLPNYPLIMMNVNIKSILVKPTATVNVGTGFELKLNGM